MVAHADVSIVPGYRYATLLRRRALDQPSPEQIARLTGHLPRSVAPLANYNYRSAWRIATDNGDFALKRDTRQGVARREAEVQRFVSGHGVPTPRITGVEDDGIGEAFAMHWVAGTPLQKRATPEAFRAIGRALSALHRLPPPPGTPPAPSAPGLLAAISPHIDYLLVRKRLEPGIAAQVIAYAQRHEGHVVTSALIHGDCQPAHFLFDDDGLAAVIDWCDAATGDPAADFGVLLLGHSQHLDDVLAGYRANREEETRIRLMLPYFMALRGAAAAEWMDSHGYHGATWPQECVVAAAARMRA